MIDADVPLDLALAAALDQVSALTRDNVLLRAALQHAQNQLAWATMPAPDPVPDGD